jgi:hypothetical protein
MCVSLHLFFLCGVASYVDVMKRLQKPSDDLSEFRCEDNSQDSDVTEQLPYKHQQSSQQTSQNGLASSPWSSKSSGMSRLFLKYVESDLHECNQISSEQELKSIVQLKHT